MTSSSFDRIKIRQSFWSDVAKLGISKEEILQKARLPFPFNTEPIVVNTEQYFLIWEIISERVSDPASAIVQLCRNINTAQLPPSILAAYHAPNYREALKRMTRYKQLCSPERISMVQNNQQVGVEIEWLYSDIKEPSMLAGYFMATLLQIGRVGSGELVNAYRIELTQNLGNKEVLEEFFGCKVEFGTQHNRLLLNIHDLELPFSSYNEELLAILTPVLDHSLGEQQRRGSISETVKVILKKNLSGGRPDIQKVAYELSVSERTLQRRLTEVGTSFKKLLTETRRELAREYLLNPSIDVKEVAFLLGYEELNSFYRAFRHWEGDTPTNWRTLNIATDAFADTIH